RIDAAIIDFYFHGHGLAVETYSATGGKTELTRSGRRHLTLAPAGVFKSREGYVVIVPVGEEMWRRLARACARAGLIGDERYRANGARLRGRAELDAIAEEWLAAQPSEAEAIRILQAGRVPCAPVLTVAEAMRNPQLLHRGTVIDV